MKRVKIGIFLLCFLLVMPLVLAIDTEVTIKTMPYREVQVAASKAGSTYQLLQRFSEQADEYGDVLFTFNFTNTQYNLYIYIKEEQTTVASDKIDGLTTGESQYFEIATPGFEFIETPGGSETNIKTNETETNEISETSEETEGAEINETEVTSEETEANESTISAVAGSVVSSIKKNKSIWIYVGVGFVVMGGIIFFLMHRKKSSSGPIRVTKFSDMGGGRKDNLDGVKKKLKDTEEEVDRLRHEMR